MSAGTTAKDWLRRALFENAAYKLVALLLSLTLFIVVHGDKDTVISFYLRVGYTEPVDRVFVGKPVDAVRVTVKGPWTRVRRFDERQVEPLQIDLAKLSDGEYVFSDDMIKLPPGLRVTSINPPSIRLQFEERASKVVAVRPVVDGEPAHGYRVAKLEANPAYVMVRGPKGVIDAMTEVSTRPLGVEGKSATVEDKLTLEPPEGHVEVVDRPTIEVRAIIVEDQGDLAVEHVPVVVRWMGPQAAPATALFAVAPTEVSVRLRGPRAVLERVDSRQVTAHVTLHAEDVARPSARPARVLVEGVPAGVAIDVTPREVTLTPGPKKR
jgi:YbbR domain-containing protein